MQIISDVTKKIIETSKEPKMAGALGASMCAAVGLGVYRDFTAIKDIIEINEKYKPDEKNFNIYDTLYKSYKSIYNSLESAYKEINSSRF